ncbi:uncharacterized protein MICPUCDRAFT_43548 [Micromonas pusilla CCMP1545]|uniref:Predicted protein n=1 Tax=Micromonas pusilla (strain CCMP1545) TaxID=564608 RepID=C1N9G1_MICPC|nr:uncharacterized protein MICPUCDRAFT_43548 [Micromonas pusilla CCMP1545]EEH51351.1 predicted protein [Micromonas pusilla CCMP1545]|eukprot:XP_003064446.1 predicted protein [Micromonas pusilla CCMP1545]
MDELLFTGLAEMTPEDRAPLVAHVMDQSNWATVRGKKLGAEPGAGPTAKKGGKKGAKGAKAGDSKVEDDEPEPEEPAAGRKRKAANSTSTAEGAGAIVVFPGKPVGKAPPAAAARATKRSKPIPVPKPTAVPKAEPKAAEPKAIDLTGASTDEDDAAAANPQPPKRPRGRPKKQPRAPAPTSPAGGYASGNAVVAVPAKGPKKSAAAAAIVRRADGGVAPHLQLAGKTIVLTGVFPELGGGCGLNLGKDKARRLCEQFGGRVTTAVSGRTDLLLVGSEPGASKVAKARSTPGCMLMNIDQLREQLTAGNALPDKGTAAAAALTSGVVINAFSGGYVGKNGGNGLAYDMSDAQLRYLATGGDGGGGPGLLR